MSVFFHILGLFPLWVSYGRETFLRGSGSLFLPAFLDNVAQMKVPLEAGEKGFSDIRWGQRYFSVPDSAEKLSWVWQSPLYWEGICLMWAWVRPGTSCLPSRRCKSWFPVGFFWGLKLACYKLLLSNGVGDCRSLGEILSFFSIFRKQTNK